MMLVRRVFGLSFLLFVLTACGSSDLSAQKKLAVGVVSYGQGSRSLEQYQDLKNHLASQLKSIIELEPAFNEVQAVQQIERKAWDVVFAPPGLAAIAIADNQYIPLLPQGGGEKERSVIVVKQDSPQQKLSDLANATIALGQVGSATGYYFPVYNLYGMTFTEIRLAPTPQTMLEWISKGSVAAGALSVAEFERYRTTVGQTKFRILFRDGHPVPSGAVLVGPGVDRNLQEQVRQALESAPPSVAAGADYVANAKPPDYSYLIKVVKRVRPIAKRIKAKPAPLY
ncbi:MAG: PhnD/SsuA/transferrin family substrate-binding protein [Thermosynechococcaceae cyanobacterium]